MRSKQEVEDKIKEMEDWISLPHIQNNEKYKHTYTVALNYLKWMLE